MAALPHSRRPGLARPIYRAKALTEGFSCVHRHRKQERSTDLVIALALWQGIVAFWGDLGEMISTARKRVKGLPPWNNRRITCISLYYRCLEMRRYRMRVYCS